MKDKIFITKVIITISLGFIVSMFFLQFASADTLLSQTVNDGDMEVSSSNYPQIFLDCTSLPMSIDKIDLLGYSNNTSAQVLRIDYSNLWYSSSSSATSSAITYVGGAKTISFNFSPAVKCEKGMGVFKVTFVSGNNIAYVRRTNSEVNSYIGCSENASFCRDPYVIFYGILSATSTECTSTSTGTGSSEIDMASTTDAIYTVGYTINLIIGIFLFLLFFNIGYLFSKKFL